MAISGEKKCIRCAFQFVCSDHAVDLNSPVTNTGFCDVDPIEVPGVTHRIQFSTRKF